MPMENTQVPNGGMLMVTVPAAQPAVANQNASSNDPRIWRPRVTKDNPDYQAVVRALPKGRDLEAYPYVCVQIHRFHDPRSGLKRIFKCCKNIPGVRNCPYCEDVWGRRNAVKDRPGVTKDDLTVYYEQLPEEVWYGNFLIRQDSNHPELNGQVKVWPHSAYQHKAFQDPVDALVNKQNQAITGVQSNGINVDTGDEFVPYDPMYGKDYYIVGKYDTEKSYGNKKKKGAPTYVGSKFLPNQSPLMTKVDVDPTTGQQVAMFDEAATYAILDQCHDLSFVLADIPTPQQAIQDLEKFWQEANQIAEQKALSMSHAGYAMPMQGQNMGAAPAMAPGMANGMTPTFASQPFQTGAYAGSQNGIPQVPANAKITTNSNAAAFMGQNPGMGQPQVTPAQSQILPTNAPAPMPVQNTPATPAYAQTPSQMMAPVNSVKSNVAPAMNPGFQAQPAYQQAPAAGFPANPGVPNMGIQPQPVQAQPGVGMGVGYPGAGMPAQPAQAPMTAPAQATPAQQAYAQAAQPAMATPAQAAPAQQAYVPPAAPPLNQPVQMSMPAAGPAPIVETDSDDDLPF